MTLSRSLKLLAAVVVAVTGLSVGAVALTAGATGTSTTYYACLKAKAGTLSKVGTTAPVCPKGSQVISWDSAGPAGPPGVDGTSVTSTALPSGDPNCADGGSAFLSISGATYACNGADGAPGATGATGAPGADGKTVLSGTTTPSIYATADVGDFYLDTATVVLYGPATAITPCLFLCTVDWGTGISLVGPAGAAGTTILNGSGPPTATTGNEGDFYVDTAAHVLYGPATHSCTPLPCQSYWGSGTNLVGPSGPSGQGPAYDVFQDAGAQGQDFGVNVPSGRSTEIATLAIPTAGDYSVVAHAEAQTQGSGTTSGWACQLEAANPGGGEVVLDSITATGYSSLSSSSTPIPLQGVVSLAAGGTISIWCSEGVVQKNDSVAQAHITATQVTSFTESS